MASAATAPDLIVRPLAANVIYYSTFTFTADTESIGWLRELNKLLTLENHNGLTLQATKNAYENARAYLTAASKGWILPIPEFTPDGEGGIDIEWENKGRRLALNFSSDGHGDFISWREPNSRYEGARTEERLFLEKLDWLMA
jgi:hypothetical protein